MRNFFLFAFLGLWCSVPALSASAIGVQPETTVTLLAQHRSGITRTSRQTAAILNDVETYIQERPDSALATIRAIDIATLTTPKLRARYALLHAMALDKNWIDTTDVNIVMPAVDYYDRHPSGDFKAKSWYYLGRIQENGKELAAASISFLKAERAAGRTKDIRFKSLVYQSLSNIYNETYLDEEALKYTKLSYELSIQVGDTLGANASLYRMAQDLNNVGRYAASDSLYQKLILDENIYPNLRQSILCNYALNLVTHSEDFDQAVQLFEEVIHSTGSLQNANFWGAYAYALVRKGESKSANQIFKQLEALNGNASDRFIYDSWKSLSDAFAGDYATAYHLQKSASDIQTDNVKKALKQSAIKAQKDYLGQVNLETERSAKKRQIVSWCSAALLLALIVLLLFIFRRRKEKSAREKEELIDTLKSLTMEHSALSSRYSDLSAEIDRVEREKASVRNKYIQLCRSHFNRIGLINEVLYYHSTEKDNNLYKELKTAVQNISMDSKGQSEFELFLNETFDNVMVHFREDFPDKKPRYYQFVSYLFAGFGSSTICAIIPGFQKHNVHVERYRLKKMIKDSDTQYKELFMRLLV